MRLSKLINSASFLRLFILTCVLVVNGCSATVISSNTQVHSTKQINKLEVPKIYKGEGLFARKQIFSSLEDTKEKQILGIYAGKINREKTTNILVAGDQKAYILDAKGNLQKEFKYRFRFYSESPNVEAEKFAFAKIKDLEGDKVFEIIGNDVLNSAIFDLQGNIVWKYKSGKEYGNFYDVISEDIDDYGKNEVIAVTDKKIEVFNAEGELVWSKDLPVWKNTKFSFSDFYVHVGNFIGDKQKEILIGKTLFDNKGKVLQQNKVTKFVGFIDDKDGKSFLAKFENNKLIFYDVEGKIKEKYNSPLSNLKRKSILPKINGYALTEAKFINVRLQGKDDSSLAVLALAFDQEVYDRFHMLYVYDAQGKLIYQEAIKSLRSNIAVLPNEDGTEKLLVSKDAKLHLYSIKK